MYRGNVRHAVSGSPDLQAPGRIRSYSHHGLGRVRTVRGRGLEMPLPRPAQTGGLRLTVLTVLLAALLSALAVTRLRIEAPSDDSWFPVPVSASPAALRG